MRTKLQLNKQAKHTTFYKFEDGISFTEHWKLVAESSEFHLTLKRVHRVHFFQLEIRKKKRDILSEKRESGMALKKLEFTPESGTVHTIHASVNHPPSDSNQLKLLAIYSCMVPLQLSKPQTSH